MWMDKEKNNICFKNALQERNSVAPIMNWLEPIRIRLKKKRIFRQISPDLRSGLDAMNKKSIKVEL